MILRTIVICGVLFLTFCSGQEKENSDTSESAQTKAMDSVFVVANDSLIDTNSLQIVFLKKGNYAVVKSKSQLLKKQWTQTPDSLKQKLFEDYLLNEIIPHWYGTPWDFSGYTDIPGQGVVACGYFVSTVMKHAGFNVNRYKLAQQNPLNEAKSVACNDSVAIYELNSRDLQKVFREKYAEGIYFAGLDFHVGFLLFRNNELYFIHSNYIQSLGVTFEKAIYSDAFNASNTYRIASLSTNKNLMKKWTLSEEIKICTDK